MNHSEPILIVDQLTKQFPTKKEASGVFTAVDAISFSLGRGEILGILGPNGAGKTTTIQMLLSTLKPTSGTITFFGKEFFTHRSQILQDIGFASTYIGMPGNLTVYENLIVHGLLYAIDKKELHNRIEALLTTFGVWHARHQEFTTLSAGQKTRVTLAKAFLSHPRVVLLDEPTAALDPDIALEVRRFVLAQQREYNVSILFTSHNMDEVTQVCNRVLVMQNGRIIANDTPQSLAASVAVTHVQLMIDGRFDEVIAYAQRHALPYSVDGLWIELAVEEHAVAPLLSGLALEKVTYSAISIEKPKLEDYFLKIAQSSK